MTRRSPSKEADGQADSESGVCAAMQTGSSNMPNSPNTPNNQSNHNSQFSHNFSSKNKKMAGKQSRGRGLKVSYNSLMLTCALGSIAVACYSTLSLHAGLSSMRESCCFYTFTDPSSNLIRRGRVREPILSQSIPRLAYYVPTEFSKSRANERQVADEMMTMEPPLEHSMRVQAVQGDCVPMAEWHTDARPNCNALHELNLPDMTVVRTAQAHLEANGNQTEWDHRTLVHSQSWADFLGQGWFRQAWEIKRSTLESSLILKMLRYERDYHDEYLDLHRRDAMAMERLTSSPYTLNVFAYCAQSAINEKAVDNVERVFMRLRKGNYEYKLQTATAVALAVADLHSIDYPDSSNATLVHYDLNPRNVAIMPDGTPKLNDFNVAEFLRWNTTSNTPCGFQGRLYEPWVSRTLPCFTFHSYEPFLATHHFYSLYSHSGGPRKKCSLASLIMLISTLSFTLILDSMKRLMSTH